MHAVGLSELTGRQATLIALGVSLAYFAVQLVYIGSLPLVMDEFDGANESYQLLRRIPYVDFRPYKTVLGYYVGLPPLLLTDDPWTGLMLSKVWLALINTGAIFAATVCVAAIFSPAAAIGGQVLLVSVSTFLERSSEVRVDMLTAWVGLASLLLLLRRRWVLAGAVAGLSFLVSQKGIYYIVSADIAAGIFWLFESRDRRTFRDLVLLNVAASGVIAAYIALWGILSTPWTVFAATFLSHNDIALGRLYNLESHWDRTLTRNPLFYWGALAGIVALALARWRRQVGATHVLAASYGAVLFALCRWHKQPWPYFFVILIPTLMVVHAAVLDYARRYRPWPPIVPRMLVLLGILYPLTYVPGILARDHSYQRHVVRLAHAMLEPGETYLAGNDLVYEREQAPAALRRLSAPYARSIRQWPQPKIDALVRDLDAARPKLVISEYRMTSLPAPLRSYMATRFAPLWSSIDGYAPLIQPDEQTFELWFDGNYRVEPVEREAVIDGRRAVDGTMMTLRRGYHCNASTGAVRLRFIPQGFASHADPAMKKKRSMFANVYNY
jgi:hypothetical protein